MTVQQKTGAMIESFLRLGKDRHYKTDSPFYCGPFFHLSFQKGIPLSHHVQIGPIIAIIYPHYASITASHHPIAENSCGDCRATWKIFILLDKDS